jgi:hypothetical protein
MSWAARTSFEVVMKALKKIIRTLKLDAMTPEFKAANAELLKAIKMNDKSGAVPHADLEAVNKAMKANDAEKVGAALKKVQLQFSKAEKKLDDEVKDVTARLAEAKKAVEKSKADLKASKADAALFDKARKAADVIKTNPRNASKLSPVADKLKKHSDLSKRVSQIVTLASSNKDVSKQIDMLKKAIDAAEKKYKKEAANVEKEAKKAKDELDVLNMRVKITQGKKDAFTKERLHIANVVKQMPQGDLRAVRKEKQASPKEERQKLRAQLSEIRDKIKSIVENVRKEWSEYAANYNDYIDKAKKTIWKSKEAIDKLSDAVKNAGELSSREVKIIYKEHVKARMAASEIMRKAYKFFNPENIDNLIMESDKARGTLKVGEIGYDPEIFSSIINLEPIAKAINLKGKQVVYGVKLEDIDREDFFNPIEFAKKHINSEYKKYEELSSKLSDLLRAKRGVEN